MADKLKDPPARAEAKDRGPAPRQPGGGSRAWLRVGLILALLVVALAGLGYYSWNLRGAHQVATRERASFLDQSRNCKLALTKSNARADGLDKQLASCGTERDTAKTHGVESEKVSVALQANLQASRAELDDLRKSRAEAEKRVAAFAALTDKFRKMIDTGKIQVQVRSGRMVMKLPAGILFDSGSAELSKAGELAIMEVAVILKGFPDRNFMVAGHTDDVPPARGARYASNWELSTARAVKVTEFLISAGMKASSLVAAGYAENDPVSKTNKQENRRIEIILLPNIEELPGDIAPAEVPK
jgi:chemotaxis protein MotB